MMIERDGDARRPVSQISVIRIRPSEHDANWWLALRNHSLDLDLVTSIDATEAPWRAAFPVRFGPMPPVTLGNVAVNERVPHVFRRGRDVDCVEEIRFSHGALLFVALAAPGGTVVHRFVLWAPQLPATLRLSHPL